MKRESLLEIGSKLGGDSWSVDRLCPECGELKSECSCHERVADLPPEKHSLKSRIEKRQGKSVTLVGEFFRPESEMKLLLKKLKAKLGCGGSFKERFVEIQGEKSKEVLEFFLALGYGRKK